MSAMSFIFYGAVDFQYSWRIRSIIPEGSGLTVWNAKNFDLMKLLQIVGSKNFITVNKLINCTPPAL